MIPSPGLLRSVRPDIPLLKTYWIDPLGLITTGFGGGGSIGLVFVIDVTGGVVADSEGNVGIFIDIDLSLGPQAAFDAGYTGYYNEGTVDDFKGENLEVQARLWWTEIGAATSDPTQEDTNRTYAVDIALPLPGGELGAGIGPSLTNAWTFNWHDIVERINQFFTKDDRCN